MNEIDKAKILVKWQLVLDQMKINNKEKIQLFCEFVHEQQKDKKIYTEYIKPIDDMSTWLLPLSVRIFNQIGDADIVSINKNQAF